MKNTGCTCKAIMNETDCEFNEAMKACGTENLHDCPECYRQIDIEDGFHAC